MVMSTEQKIQKKLVEIYEHLVNSLPSLSEEKRHKIRKRVREHRKDNLITMKGIADGLRYINSEEKLEEYKWYANMCVRLKKLEKTYS